MKKLLYVYAFSLKASGVYIKLQGQIKAFEKKYNVTLISPQFNKNGSVFHKLIAFLLFQIKAFFYSLKKDILYVRYSPYIILYNIFLIPISFVKTVYIEHNSKMEQELELANKKLALKIHRMFLFMSKFGNVFHIGVTKEICISLEENISISKIKYIQNGYSELNINKSKTDKEVLTNLKNMKEKYDKLGIFVGNNYPWHGVDKVIELFKNMKNILIVIVGDYNIQSSINNICFLGKLNINTLKEIYTICDFGIGSMALDIIKLKEACPLKTREYLFNGLPILVNYKDSASDIPKLNKYIFNIKENADALSGLLNCGYDRKQIVKDAKSELNWDKLLDEI